MTFRDDGGGFALKCDDAKFSIDASTWNTKLSRIGMTNGAIYIMTKMLPNPNFIAKILSKRPANIYILANVDAELNAKEIKSMFPDVQVGLPPTMDAKVVFIEPETIWISSADFGESKIGGSRMITSSIGIHSTEVYKRGVKEFFAREWKKAKIL